MASQRTLGSITSRGAVGMACTITPSWSITDLELTRDLLDRAKQNANHPIPVVFHTGTRIDPGEIDALIPFCTSYNIFPPSSKHSVLYFVFIKPFGNLQTILGPRSI